MITIKCLKSLKSSLRSIINTEVDRDCEVLFIVPESSKASVEREVFNALTKNGKQDIKAGNDIVTSGILKQDVLSFLKFAQRIVSNSGDESITGFDDVMLRNVIYNILVKHGSEFKNISKFVGKFEYIDKLIAILGDFSRFGITPLDLDEVISNEKPEDVFYEKVYDIKLLMEYISEVNEEYGFSLLESDLIRASEFIDKALSNGDIPNKRIYSYIRNLQSTKLVIQGFGSSRSFTPQEFKFLSALDRLGCEMDIYVLYDKDNEDKEVFFFGKTLMDSMRKEGLEFNVVDFDGIYEAKDNDLGEISSAYAFDESVKHESPDGSIELLKLVGKDDALSFVCNEIIRLTREEGYRYRDIRVFIPDDDLTDRFKSIMRLFKLDAFIDKRLILQGSPVMRLIELILDLPIQNYPIEKIIGILRTGLLPVTFEQMDYFENFCLQENITFGNKIFDENRYKNTKFTIYINNKIEPFGGSVLWNDVVKKVLIPLKNVAERVFHDELISTKAKDLMEYIDTLRPNLEYLRDEFVSRNDTVSASLLVRSYKEIMILLAAFNSELNDVAVTPEAFNSLIKTDMKNKSLATIPLTVDSIELVDSDSACNSPCKILLMVGCTSENFPFSKHSEGIMSNEELQRLNSEMTIDLPDKVRTKSREEFIKSAQIINAATDKILMVNTVSDVDSEIFTFLEKSYVKKIAKNIDFYTPVYGRPVEKNHDIRYSSIDEEMMIALLNGKYTGSVSSFETFNYCSLEYMLDKVLKIRKRSDGTSIQINQIGTLVHSMFEKTMKDIVSEYDTPEKLRQYLGKMEEQSFLEDVADEAFEKTFEESDISDKESEYYKMCLGAKARRIFMKAMPKLIEYCADSGFVPCGFEKELQTQENKLSFTTENGVVFEFRGAIDRVDYNSELNCYRIVDYKTGKKEIDPEQLAYGLQIQLFAYALVEQMQGSEIDNVGYIETRLEPASDVNGKGASDYVYKQSPFEPEMIKEVCSLVKALMQRTCEQISIGKADALVNPKGKTFMSSKCDYCAYRGLCGNHPNRLMTDKTDYEITDDKKLSKNEKAVETLRKRSEAPWNFRNRKMN